MTAQAESGSARRVIAGFCQTHSDDPLARVAWFLATKESLPAARPVRTTGAASIRRLAKDVLQRTRASRREFFAAGEVLLAVESENQRRVLDPVARELAGGMQPVRTTVRWREQRRLSGHALRLARELEAAISGAGAGLPLDTRLWFAYLRDAAHALGYARSLLRSGDFAVAVIASTHGPVPRALAAAAREQSIPSVYIPHAPVLTDAAIVDLPVDFAALRGPAEVEHYASFGVDPSRLTVVGDPSIARGLRPVETDPALPPVFAPSPDPPDQLRKLVALIAEATSGPVTISPHPRSDRSLLRAISPEGWELWDRRTLDLLEQGPRLLIQHSSGVALEALQLGIAVVDLALDERDPVYPFIRAPYATRASTAEELRTALEGRGGLDRDELVAWARRWVALTGAEAAAQAATTIERAAQTGSCTAPIWDAWSALSPAAARPSPS